MTPKNGSSRSGFTAGLTLEQVSFSYQNHRVLSDVSICVPPGTVVALLGKNGSGKSTTLNLAAGLLVPDGGKLNFNGFIPHEGSQDFKRELGVSFDRLPDFGMLTLKEIIEFSARIRNYRLTKNWGELLEGLSLEKHAHLPVQALSKGLQQKLGILLATFHRPALLLLDEPTSGLDPYSLRQVRTLLRAASEQGTAILISTHALDEVSRLSDRVYIISKGVIVANGTAQDIARQVGKKVQLILETHPMIEEKAFIELFPSMPSMVVSTMKDGHLKIQLSEEINVDKDFRAEMSTVLLDRGYLLTYLCQEMDMLETAFISLTEKSIA